MNEELDSQNIQGSNEEPQKTITTEVDDSQSQDELNESMQSEILSEESEDKFNIDSFKKLSLTDMVEEAKKVLVLTPTAALKRFNAIQPVFNEKFNLEKEKAQNAFTPEEGEEVSFTFEKENLHSEIKDLYQEIKKAREEEKKRIEEEKQKNLSKKLGLLNAIEELVKNDETSDSIDKIKEIQKEWKTIRVLPKNEINNLWDRYTKLLDQFYDNHSINIELKELDRKKNLEAKIELTKKVEEIAKESSLKRSFILLNKYHEEFKNIGPVPKESREPIWEAFKSASDAIYAQKRAVYDKIKEEQEENLKKKEVLAERAELLSFKTPKTNKDWTQMYNEFEKLFAEWKKIGPVPKSNKDAVWIKFNGFRNDFFTKRKEHFSIINAERSENLKKKEALCEEVEKLKDSTQWNETSKKIIQIQKQWKEIGPIPDKVNQAVWKRFRLACDNFFNNKSKAFEGKKEEEASNLKLKEEIIAKLEKLNTSDIPYKEAFAELKKLGAEWRKIGFVPHKAVKRISKSYEEATNAVYSKHKEAAQKFKQENLKEHYNSLKESPNAIKTLDFEIRNLKRKISGSKEEISSIERNLSFFSKSKTADKLLKDFESKIQKLKKQIATHKAELSVVQKAKKDVMAKSEESNTEET